MSRMNRRRFTWIATGGVASAALVACGNSDDEDLTPTRIADVQGAPPTLAPNATPPDTSGEGGGEEATPVEGGGGGPQTHVVDMENDLVFHPEELTINVGDTINWVNNGAIVHTATCDPEIANDPAHSQLPEGAETWNSGDMAQGDEFEHTFEVAGEYTYFCIPHEATGMIGYITVQEGGGGGGEEAPAEESPEDGAAEEEAAAGESGGGQAITVTGHDNLTWDPSEFEVAPGQDIHVVNGGALQHDFYCDELGIESDMLNGGEETTVTVPDDAEVGAEYVYYCSVPGHRQGGMEGTLTIVEA